MYLKVHPTGSEQEWLMFKVPDGAGYCRIARREAVEYSARTGKPAETVPNVDARWYRSQLSQDMKRSWPHWRGVIIEDPDEFKNVFMQ